MGQPYRGALFTFEGIEGSGKSTQARLLTEFLRKLGLTVCSIREPGGTKWGEAIRSLLLDNDLAGMPIMTEVFLYQASRAAIVEVKVIPSLKRGEIVILDRFADSSMAYQGGGRGVDIQTIDLLNRITTSDLIPDITVLMDIDPEKGLERIAKLFKVPDRIESEALAFHRRVRAAFLELAKRSPERYLGLDGSLSEEINLDRILDKVLPLLQSKGLIPPRT